MHITSSRFSERTQDAWFNKLGSSSEPPTLKDLKDFMENRLIELEAKESSNHSATGTSSSSGTPKVQYHQNTSKKGEEKPTVPCSFCSQPHRLYKCSDFKTKSTKEKFDFLNSRNLCLNCFNNHQPKNKCPIQSNSGTCHKQHRTAFHSFVSPNSKSAKEHISNPDTKPLSASTESTQKNFSF